MLKFLFKIQILLIILQVNAEFLNVKEAAKYIPLPIGKPNKPGTGTVAAARLDCARCQPGIIGRSVCPYPAVMDRLHCCNDGLVYQSACIYNCNRVCNQTLQVLMCKPIANLATDVSCTPPMNTAPVNGACP